MYTRQWVGIWNQASLNLNPVLSLAGCAVLDKLPGHHELSFPCLSTEIRCDTAVSNGFNHACAKPTCKVWHRASHHAWAVGLPFWELVSLLA